MNTEQVKTNGSHPQLNREVVSLLIEDLDAHPDQPRKHFRKLDELAQTIVLHGVLEPILVRPKKANRYEIIFGERRVRASKIAKQKTIPAFVRVIDDAEAEKMMLIENGQREDLHEIEEAEAYERLRKVHGMSVEDISVKVGKTVATVYARMKLCALCKVGREACFAGKITPAVALHIARIPNEKLQIEALAELEKQAKQHNQRADEDDRANVDEGAVATTAKLYTPVSERDAFTLIRRRFMLRLADAPFDIADVQLTKAGACTTCPNRTGNQAELFADVKSADVCTLPPCFKEKRDAEWKVRVAKAKTAKQDVLPDDEAKKNFDTHDGSLSWQSEFIDVDALGYIDGKQTSYRKKLGGKLPPTILARDPEGGIHELVKKSAVTGAGREVTPAEKKRQIKEKEQHKKDDAKAAIRERCDELAIAAMTAKAEGKQPAADFYRALIVFAVRDNWNDDDTHNKILRRRGLVKKDEELDDIADEGKHIQRIVSKLSEKTARGLLIEIVAAAAVNGGAHVRGERTEYDMLCDFYKVDPKKFAAEAKASVGAGAKS